MKEGKIFLISQEGENLIPMTETMYSAEDILQALLVQYPDLLPGDQITPESPRRWLLVAREMGVPGAEHETGRWSLDHLFLDQDGIPTFVECKRSSDTRGRREVVAQMLDYAANGIQYWGMDRLRQAAAETAERQGRFLDEQVQALLEAEEDTDIESFWNSVEQNLQNGRVRLIFVADETPPELRRLVEFLNEKMADVEVLAVEVKQYTGMGQKALVSRVVGATEAARSKKTSAPRRRITRQEFMSQLPPGLVGLFERIFEEVAARGHAIEWRTKYVSIRAYFSSVGRHCSFLYALPDGRVQFYFHYLPLDEQESQLLRQKLMEFGLFAPTGEQTLTAKFDESEIDRVWSMVQFVLDEMNEIAGRY